MPYREDEDALLARNDALEAEVERLQAERDRAVHAKDEAEAKLRAAEAKPAAAETRPAAEAKPSAAEAKRRARPEPRGPTRRYSALRLALQIARTAALGGAYLVTAASHVHVLAGGAPFPPLAWWWFVSLAAPIWMAPGSDRRDPAPPAWPLWIIGAHFAYAVIAGGLAVADVTSAHLAMQATCLAFLSWGASLAAAALHVELGRRARRPR